MVHRSGFSRVVYRHVAATCAYGMEPEQQEQSREAQIADARRAVQAQWSATETTTTARIVFLPPGALGCGLEVRLTARQARQAPLVLVPLLDEQSLRYATHYLVTAEDVRAHGQPLPGGAVALRLGVCRSLGEHAQQPAAVTDDAMLVEPEPPSLPATPAPSRALWLHEAGAGDQCLSDDMRPYCAALLDFVLLQQAPLRRRYPRLERKWRAALLPAALPGAGAALHWLARALQAGGRDLAHHWVRMEVALLQLPTDDDEALDFHRALREHCALTDAAGWQHGLWHRRRVPGSAELDQPFWRRVNGDYLVHAHWLLEEELEQCARRQSAPPSQGLVALTGDEWRRCLLPSLYRHALLDTVEWLCARPCDEADDPLTKAMARLALRPPVPTLYEFLVRELHAGQLDASPVSKRVRAYLEAAAQPRDSDCGGGGGRRRPWAHERALALTVPDLEDLFRAPGHYLPPCLARAIPQPWYKHHDRLLLVAALLDGGYSDAEAAVHVLCRGKADTPEHRHLIREMWQDLARKKQRARDEGHTNDRASWSCDVLINSKAQEGNVARCPYEEALNGGGCGGKAKPRRGDHTDAERDSCRAQCAQSLGVSAIYGPMDYVSYRLLQLDK